MVTIKTKDGTVFAVLPADFDTFAKLSSTMLGSDSVVLTANNGGTHIVQSKDIDELHFYGQDVSEKVLSLCNAIIVSNKFSEHTKK